jgi:hypothetical protein
MIESKGGPSVVVSVFVNPGAGRNLQPESIRSAFPFLIRIGTDWAPENLTFLPVPLAFLINVLNGGLVDHQIRLAVSVHLDAIPVIPLDGPMNFLTITQHHHHRRLRLHLLLVIEIFRVGSLWGRSLPSPHRGALYSVAPLHGSLHMVCVVHMIMFVAVQRWPDEFAIGECFLLHRLFSWHGINCIFHDCTACAQRAARSATTPSFVIVGTEVVNFVDTVPQHSTQHNATKGDATKAREG